MYGSLILNIVFTGASYALVSVPFALILGIMHMINFAHGEFITIGAFATYVFVLLFGFDYTLAVPAAGVSAAILGLICERVIFRHLRGKFFALSVCYARTIIPVARLFPVNFRAFAEIGFKWHHRRNRVFGSEVFS